MIEEVTMRKLTACAYYLCKVIHHKSKKKFDMHHLGSLLWEFQGIENNLKHKGNVGGLLS
jgi:hypothetical protein